MDAFKTHLWSDGPDTPHQIDLNGRKILHHRCLRCGRDFVQALDGPDWQAAYIGILTVEPVDESVSARWLTEDCPGRMLEEDIEQRRMRRR